MVDRTMYISGQIGFDPKTMEIVSGGVEAEASQVGINRNSEFDLIQIAQYILRPIYL